MTKYNTLLKKVNQTGSMMIEALAMLTLISLVTPTLYKKSAERTTELQDINTATQVRTLSKAVDNFVMTNYQAIMKELPEDGTGRKTLEAGDLEGFLPYGYKLEASKNYDKPIIVVKRQEGTDALTSFVIFPKTGEVNDFRASQIASMVGANGGYITVEDGEKMAKGVGGVWSLNEHDLDDMLPDGVPGRGTLVTASSESINDATRNSFENIKYLQRTKTENEEWRNTMMTDLYMGGTLGLLEGQDRIPKSKILGVDQLIIGAIKTGEDENETNSSLVVKADVDTGRTGSAFIEDGLYALNNAFSVFKNNQGNDELNFANSLLKVTQDHFSVNVTQGGTNDFFIEKGEGADIPPTAQFNVATTVANTFEALGNTYLASDEDAILNVGPGGSVMAADKNVVNIQDGNVVIDNGQAEGSSSTLIATDKLNVKGSTKISGVPEGDEIAPSRGDLELMLNVQGDAFVSKTLEAGEVDAHKFDALRLYAGGTNYEKENENDDHYMRWLNVDENGIVAKELRDTNNERPVRMRIDQNEASIYGPDYKDGAGSVVGRGQMTIGATDAHFAGLDLTTVATGTETGQVSIQGGAIVAKNKVRPEDTGVSSIENQVELRGTEVFVYGNDRKNKALEIRPGEGATLRSESYVKADVDQFVVQKAGKKLLNVVSGENDVVLGEDSVAEIDPEKFRIWAKSEGENINNRIFEVNAADGRINGDGEITGDVSNVASVYVRRGAIELESSPAASNTYAADEGVGYIEASRFVSNNLEADGQTIREPRFANSSGYETSEKFDRYMVNPAYTSVMHDIKLTTRGGARLSDILPDFINKGIYIVNNDLRDGINFNNLSVSNNGGTITASNSPKAEDGDWASPFMGMVPAPQCPPGHARVITLTPASFQMAQTGDMVKNQDGRYYVSNPVKLGVYGNLTNPDSQGNQLIQTPTPLDAVLQVGLGENDTLHMYYLGMAPDTMGVNSNNTTYTEANTPKPLYFQQSTWLKSKVVAYSTGPCTGSQAGNGGCSNFMGWATVMGFIYPYAQYYPIIDLLSGKAHDDVDATEDSLAGMNKVYWNVFPVRPRTMEAYATVYCYFDRTNIFGSGNNGAYVDQYDQMHNFRSLGQKAGGGTVNQGTQDTNTDYINRLNDPQLKYNDPW